MFSPTSSLSIPVDKTFATAAEIWDWPSENEFYISHYTDATTLAVLKAVGRLRYDEELGGWLIPSPISRWYLVASDFTDYTENNNIERYSCWLDKEHNNLAVILKNNNMTYQAGFVVEPLDSTYGRLI